MNDIYGGYNKKNVSITTCSNNIKCIFNHYYYYNVFYYFYKNKNMELGKVNSRLRYKRGIDRSNRRILIGRTIKNVHMMPLGNDQKVIKLSKR